MNAAHGIETRLPNGVEQTEWREALGNLLVKEKAATRALDQRAAGRYRLPMVSIENKYVFAATAGKLRRLGLVDERR
jgi:predicted dithiol-disulfide oxidoreductase (DUF899 family)